MTVAQGARVDARRMLCDQAVMAAARAIRSLPPGGRLEVLTASDSVRGDLRAWADRLGHPRGPEVPGEGVGEVVLSIEKSKHLTTKSNYPTTKRAVERPDCRDTSRR